MAEAIGKVIGTCANGIVEVMDVDGVVRQVDINSALERIDMDALVGRIDMNKLLDSVDLNRQLDRIDTNGLMSRIDINNIVLRSNVGAILAHSTTGIFTEVLDALRRQVIMFDMWIMDVTTWLRRRNVGMLPPAPPGINSGSDEDDENNESNERPRGRSESAVLVQGRYTGVVSKGIAFLIDSLFVTFSFAILLIVAELTWMFLAKNDDIQKVNRDNFWTVVAYCTYWFLYFLVSTLLTGVTVGMAIVGIKVVDTDTGDCITFKQAVLRTLLLPLSSTVAVFLVAIGIFRRDGRMLHDVAAGTGLVYKWNAEMARFRENVERKEENNQSSARTSLIMGDGSAARATGYSTFPEW